MNYKKLENGFLIDGLRDMINKQMKKALEDLSLNYSIKNNGKIVSLNELYEKYCIDDLKIDYTKKKKRKKNKQLSKDELCMAKKADGCQCTRRRKDTNEYCGKHLGNLKFGRIDDDEKYKDKEKYIKTMHEKINGNDYLVDENNVVYSFDKNNPTVLGAKIDGKLVLADELK
jgi:hypothetical protein